LAALKTKRKVLLLNPPGRQPYLRDYYCSKVSKGNYLYHPVDLLIISGWLHEDFDVHFLDCIAEKKSPAAARDEILRIKPEAIVFLTGSVSKHEDYPFLACLKAELGFVAVGTGDCLLDEPARIREEAPWLDAIVLDFTLGDTASFLRNLLYGATEPCPNLLDLNNQDSWSAAARTKTGYFRIPVPRHELFSHKNYSYPFVRRPFATVLTDYGCPYRCIFCVQPGLGYRLRELENVIEELDYVHQLGLREIYFSDQTFGANRKRAKELCEAMLQRNYRFGWAAFSRADCVDRDTIRLMKQSGCHTLMFGVEIPVQHVLDAFHKDLSLAQVEEAISLCRREKIRSVATFIIGLPGTAYEQNLEILEYAKRIEADFASFNVLVPRCGTQLRNMVVEQDSASQYSGTMDQSGISRGEWTGPLTSEQLIELRKKISRGFYLRPSYLLRRLAAIRSSDELLLALTNGCRVIRNSIPRRNSRVVS
jgi:anaerobic magnesium-protoporphyrin IX monomethyl ester cyclase